jgi:phosphatidylinositol 4-kinase
MTEKGKIPKIESIKKIEFSQVQPKDKKCSFSFSYICKCFKLEKDKDKDYYIEKWRQYLTNESTSKIKMNDPFIILANIWAHKPVIKYLENVRINPNLIRKERIKTLSNIIIRNDLEFYIPQLCSFIIFGETELVDELLSFLCKSCYCSFFFAHRVIWFLKSMLSNDNHNENNSEMNHKINDIIHTIQTIFKSDTEKDKKTLKKYFIAGGDIYTNSNRGHFTDSIDLINNENEITTEASYNNCESNIIKINIFTKYGYRTNTEEMIIKGGMNSIINIDENDINLTSFLSNINFFDHLTNICERIRFIDSPEMRQSELIKEMTKINENLPYNVYIPFSNREIRNNLICHISIKDTKVYKTKERAPIILTFECFRLEELCYEHNVKIKTQILNEEIKTETNQNSLLSSSESKREINSQNSKVKYHLDKMNYLMSVDIALSKPIFVRKSNNSYNKKQSSDISDDEKFDKIDKVLQRKKSEDSMNSNIINNSSSSNQKENEQTQSMSNEQNININTKNIIENDKINIKKENDKNNNNIYSNLDLNIINASKIKMNRKKREDSFDINAEFSESSSSSGEENSGSFNSSAIHPLGPKTSLFNKISNYGQSNIHTFNILQKNQISNYSLVFGETLASQEARLKYQSQYGYLSSYKVCKVLIKSGEDLRQEQFASQLINEFSQIFKIEDVDCYLYPYEIISTGNNAGIIEVCPNTISLDELKHKMSFDPNNSLKVFYEKYFGKGTKKYKKALRNLVRSLAGYSLVCYFLQIKDRHNGNILINNEGYLIQIDFGFFLSNAPGGEFEKAPFKLTDEVIEVIGGINSKYFQIFRKLMWKGMLAIAKHYEKIMILVEMMYCGYGKKLECFKSGDLSLTKLRERFRPKKNMKKRDYLALVDELIQQALSSWRTKWYDKYQYFFEGIFY